MMILIVTIVYVIFIIPDIIPMLKEKEYGVMSLYLSILIIAYTLTFLISLDVKIPSPQPLIKNAIISITGSSEKE